MFHSLHPSGLTFKITLAWILPIMILAGCRPVGASLAPEILQTPSGALPQHGTQSYPTSQPVAPIAANSTIEIIPTPGKSELPFIALEVTTSTPYSPTITRESGEDLLFLADSNLMHWQPSAERTDLLLSDVWDYAASADAGRIAILQSRKITANGSQLFDINIYEPKSGAINSLVNAIPEPLLLSIAPDGRHVTYWDRHSGGVVKILQVNNPTQPIQPGNCASSMEANCQQLLWSPDGRELLWSDSRGIWVSKNSQAARLAVSGAVQFTDPHGNQSEVNVIYRPIDWSPEGRFILAEAIPSATGVHWLAVLDIRTGQAFELPYTFSNLGQEIPSWAATWLNDGKLALIYNDLETPEKYPRIRLYKVMPTNQEFIVLDREMQIFETEFMLSATDHPGNIYSPAWLDQTGPEVVSFALIPSEPVTPPVLVSLNYKKDTIGVLHTLPDDTTDVVWSQNNTDAIVLGEHSRVFWAPTEPGPLLDLHSLFGADFREFLWIENLVLP